MTKRRSTADSGHISWTGFRDRSKTMVVPLAEIIREVEKPGQPPGKSVTEEKRKAAASEQKQVLVFFGGKGGAGTTTLAVNVADSLVRARQRVCLLDLNLQLGDALGSLALRRRTAISDVLDTIQREGTTIPGRMDRHESGLAVLSQVGSLRELDKVGPEPLSEMVADLCQHFDHIVVDGVNDFSDHVLPILDMADKLAIVTVQEVLAFRRTRRAFDITQRIGFSPEEITIIINQFDPTSKLTLSVAQDMFKVGQILSVETNRELVRESLDRGIPLSMLRATHSLVQSVDDLARALTGEKAVETPPATKGEAGILGRLFSRRHR